MKITKVTITPVAFADPPLLNAVGVHEPFALRAIVEVATDAGLTGLGETYADEHHLAGLTAVARAIEGVDVYQTGEIYRRVQAVTAPTAATPPGMPRAPGDPILPGDVIAFGQAAAVGGTVAPGESPIPGGSPAPGGAPVPSGAAVPGESAVPGEQIAPDGPIASGLIGHSAVTDRVFSPFEVACLDIQGQAAGRPVCDLLGGAVRSEVPFSAYLFYKWAAHPGGPGRPVAARDPWGPALDPESIVAQAMKMVSEYGFTAIKLKGGVFPPEQEIEAIRALRDAFPRHPLRLDPNAAWTPWTALRVARELEGVLEYLEDPTPGIDGMAEVAQAAPMPLATNMCVVAFDHLPPAIRKHAVQVILSDHHYWGGLRKSMVLAGICETFGIGLSMHSNSHLGISLAAMVHLAAATPNLTYACDTHWPWKTEDVIEGEPLTFNNGALRVPSAPGLGVSLDRDALARLHEQYLTSGIRNRDDTGYMRRIDPSYVREEPRWLTPVKGYG
jgi:glucarate dehydratase